jgi:hypothetical protein
MGPALKNRRQKTGRHQPCPCGSGFKYKRCHGRLGDTPAALDLASVPEERAAAERIRVVQQGGRPVIATKVNEHQLVAVGKSLHWSKTWKTFPDFLADYIKKKIGPEWGNAEIAKPLPERHPLMQWYDAYCRYQAMTIKTPGEVHSAEITGIVACYLGVAYALYLLDHNVELQARLINRLKNPVRVSDRMGRGWVPSLGAMISRRRLDVVCVQLTIRTGVGAQVLLSTSVRYQQSL